MTESTRKLSVLVYKVALAAIVTCALLYVSGTLFADFTPWQEFMDPRKQLLWDANYDGSKYVLLGDSEFCSYYVDSPDKTIWARVQSTIKQKVFPGALDGCKPADLVTQGRFISATWPPNTTVFIDIVPTRFLFSRLQEPENGNYDYAFRRKRIDSNSKGINLKYIKNTVNYIIGQVSFFFRNETALKTLVDGMVTHPVYYKKENNYNRIWHKEVDSFAYNRFQIFENNVISSKGVKSFDWISKLHKEFDQKGIKVVFVLTPLNVTLVRKYATPDSANSLISYFDHAHNEVSYFLAKNDLSKIDLYNAAGKDDFADMVHTNEQGDKIIADAISVWIKLKN